jgi:hypothetical protein
MGRQQNDPPTTGAIYGLSAGFAQNLLANRQLAIILA